MATVNWQKLKSYKPEPASVLYWFSFILGLSWTLYISLASDGVPVHDEIAHFLLSKNAWQDPQLLLTVWGRPVRNLLYWLPASGGLGAARLFSIALTGLTILIASRIGSILGIRKLFLIPLLIWFQPWVSGLSFAVLPQVPFSFLLVSGIYLGLKEKYIPASLVFGLLPLTRHEGIAVLGVWILFLLVLRKWKALMAAFIPLIAFNAVYYLVRNDFAFRIYFDANPTDRYGQGGWLHYIRPLPGDVGILILVLCMISVVPIMKSRRKALVFLPYITYFLTHIIIFRFGLFASGGYQLFLLPLAPAFGLAAAIGVEFVLSFFNRLAGKHGNKRAASHAAWFLLIMTGVAVIFTGLQTKPVPLDREGRAMQQAADWLQANNVDRDRVISTHVWFEYFYDIVSPYKAPPIDELPPGSIIVWNNHYADRRGVYYDQLIDPENCWQKIESFGEDEMVILFRKSSDEGPCP